VANLLRPSERGSSARREFGCRGGAELRVLFPGLLFAGATSPNQIKIENTCCIVGRPLGRRPGCPFRVICGHGGRTAECPRSPRKRTSSEAVAMSAKCQ